MLTPLLPTLSFLLGGIGLFLIGMKLLSEGLETAAGGALQKILERFTRSAPAGFVSGMCLTALVQSSSATTVATIGFVSAGLLSFTSSVGVIIGANVGTTSTGWIVSLLGFKLSVGAMALPLIGAGGLTQLLGRGRWSHLGWAMAGFGLIFVGIDFLQSGMGAMAQRVDFSVFSADTLGGQLVLVAVGFVITALVQSSSVAVALTLTALATGSIGPMQAAYLVIGQNLGTTLTAALVSLGAAVPAKRTAAVHILFNVFTGILAFGMAAWLIDLLQEVASDEAVLIALFHTAFNVIGAVVILPLARPFARLVARIVPDRGRVITRHLDKSLLSVPSIALEATTRAMVSIATLATEEALGLLAGSSRSGRGRDRLLTAREAIPETTEFLAAIRLPNDAPDQVARRLDLIHAGDHLERLVLALLERRAPLQGSEVLSAGNEVSSALEPVLRAFGSESGLDEVVVQMLKDTSERQARLRRTHRSRLLEETAAGRIPPAQAHAALMSMAWIDRIVYHLWRASSHLKGTPTDQPGEASPPPDQPNEASPPPDQPAPSRSVAPLPDPSKPHESTGS